MAEAVTRSIAFLQSYYPYLLITLSIWITYWYAATKAGFVSDDILGILNYDGLLQTRSSEKITYDTKLTPDEKKSKIEELNNRPLITKLIDSEYGMISRWLRYVICGGTTPSKVKIKNAQGQEVSIPKGKIPTSHHRLIIIVFNLACLSTFHFLQNIIGRDLALLSVILFTVHPVGVQAIAWASGLGYPLSLFWMAAMINLVPFLYHSPTIPKTIIGTLFFCLFQFLGIHAQMIPMATCVILWFLGYKAFAILSAIISILMLFDIVKQTVDYRKDEFKKQQMGESTTLHAGKFVVAMKTLLYYLGLAFVPRKMGLYHEWGFHYDKNIEKPDKLFFLGFLAFLGLLGIFFLSSSIIIKFSILWFISTSIIFWNWVTIQQWVTERYIFIPSLAVCIVISYLTRNCFPLYCLILGIYLCRSWMHMPTYDNEMRFYESNVWNFPDSEIAYGNLGVARMNAGLPDMASDTWKISTLINPEYDVPWYNLFSTQKTKAVESLQQGRYMESIQQLQIASSLLERVLACKVCHFPEMWKKEKSEIILMVQNPSLFFQKEFLRLEKLASDLNDMLLKSPSPQRTYEIQVSIDNNSVQINRLNKFMADNRISAIVSPDILSKLFKKENA